MIELLKIHALVRTARVLVFGAAAARGLSGIQKSPWSD
jgi:hypothetical protein